MAAESISPIHTRELTGAGMWSGVIKRGRTLRLTDLEGGANVGVLLYNADLLVERYNMPDTLKEDGELDRILDKIRFEGMEALSEAEKATLDKKSQSLRERD